MLFIPVPEVANFSIFEMVESKQIILSPRSSKLKPMRAVLLDRRRNFLTPGSQLRDRRGEFLRASAHRRRIRVRVELLLLWTIAELVEFGR